jgi:hypothetical protein
MKDPLGSFIIALNPLLSGLAPSFGFMPTSYRKIHELDAVALLDFWSKSFFYHCFARPKPG